MNSVIDVVLVNKRLADELPQWQVNEAGTNIHKTWSTRGWKSSLMIANAIGFLAEAAWHHPEIVVCYANVTVRLTTHSAGGITEKDLELAKKIEALIQWQGDGDVLQPPPEKYAVLKRD